MKAIALCLLLIAVLQCEDSLGGQMTYPSKVVADTASRPQEPMGASALRQRSTIRRLDDDDDSKATKYAFDVSDTEETDEKTVSESPADTEEPSKSRAEKPTLATASAKDISMPPFYKSLTDMLDLYDQKTYNARLKVKTAVFEILDTKFNGKAVKWKSDSKFVNMDVNKVFKDFKKKNTKKVNGKLKEKKFRIIEDFDDLEKLVFVGSAGTVAMASVLSLFVYIN